MELLGTIWRMSLVGSSIFLILFLLKPITKRYFNASWHFSLLVVTLLFFVIPIYSFVQMPALSLSNFGTSVQNVEDEAVNAPTQANNPAISPAENENRTQNNQNSEENELIQNPSLITDQEREMEIPAPITNQESERAKWDIGNFRFISQWNSGNYQSGVQWIWLLGAVAFLIFKIAQYLKFRSFVAKNAYRIKGNVADISDWTVKKIHDSEEAPLNSDQSDLNIKNRLAENKTLELFNQCKKELSIKGEIELLVCEAIGSPMLVGILKPKVLLPNLDMNAQSLRMIFLHELNHYKRKDIAIKFFALFVQAVHWFNPLVYLLQKDMEQYCEYAVDEKVVEKMDLHERKYYGETIIHAISGISQRNNLLTTAMGTDGKKLKSRLENMIFSFRTTKRMRVVSIFSALLIFLSGFTVACSVLPKEEAKINNSFFVYKKIDGLYYSRVDIPEEIKIHEGKDFAYPLISKSGRHIAYRSAKQLYVYDVEAATFEEITDKLDDYNYYVSYDWIDDERLIFGTAEPGFTIYNAVTKEKTHHQDEYSYLDMKVASNGRAYAVQWIALEKDKDLNGDNSDGGNQGIVEIDLKVYNEEIQRFKTHRIIESKRGTDGELGYNPRIWNVSADGRYIFIKEEVASASLSTDLVGIGIYDTTMKTHDVIQRDGKNVFSLRYKDHLTMNPHDRNQIAIIEGEGRDMIVNKKVTLIDIEEIGGQKNMVLSDVIDDNLLTMTPSFTMDGKKLLYSASEGFDVSGPNFDFNEAYTEWETQPHPIYEWDLETEEAKQITKGENFDYMPMSISEEDILFMRYKGEGKHEIIQLSAGKETVLAEDAINESESKSLGFYGHPDIELGFDLYVDKEEYMKNYKTPEEIKRYVHRDNMIEFKKYEGTDINDSDRILKMLTLLDLPEDLIPIETTVNKLGDLQELIIQYETKETSLEGKERSDYVYDAFLKTTFLHSVIDDIDQIKVIVIMDGRGSMTYEGHPEFMSVELDQSFERFKTYEVERFEKFKEYEGTYVGDNSKVGQIVNLLHFPLGLTYNEMALQTTEKPYAIKLFLQSDVDTALERDIDDDIKNRISDIEILFTLIDNVDIIEVEIKDRKNEVTTITLERESQTATLEERHADSIKNEEIRVQELKEYWKKQWK